MPLTLNPRNIASVTVIRCAGRIVTGPESDSLRELVYRMLPDDNCILLQLAEVDFIDSGGLGMLVRLLTKVRQGAGDLKLCNVTPNVLRVLKLTNVTNLFGIYDSEEEAVTSFFTKRATTPKLSLTGPEILCVDQSADVLSYLTQLLRNGGYHVLTSSNVPDALILMKATCPAVVVLGPELLGSTGAKQVFREKCRAVPVVELGEQFSTRDAGEAGSELLAKIRSQVASATGTA